MARRAQQRARGEGSIYRDGTGWRWAISLPDGTRPRGRATTRDEAAKRMRAAQRRVEDGQPLPGRASAITVEQWVTHVIDTNPRLRPKTRKGYRSKASTLIYPRIGSVKVTALKAERVERWLVELHRAGQSPASCRQAFAIVAHAMVRAHQRGLVTRNPVEHVSPPSVKRKPPTPLEVDEAKAILKAAVGRWNGARWALALTLGLRPGEATGIPLDALNLGDARLTIRQELSRVPYEHGCAGSCVKGVTAYRCPQRFGGGLDIEEVKSDAGVRTLALPASLVDALREHLRERARAQLRAGSEWQESGLLFVRADGTPIPPEWDWRDWHELLEVAGLPKRRPYDTRHTAATFLALQGVHPRVAMEILGHSQISLTQHVYTHVLDEGRRSAADAVDALLWEQKTGAAQTGKRRTGADSTGRGSQHPRGKRT